MNINISKAKLHAGLKRFVKNDCCHKRAALKIFNISSDKSMPWPRQIENSLIH